MHRRTNHRSGYSLLELMISLAILTLVTGAIGLAGMTSSNLFKTRVERTALETQLRRSLDRLRQSFLASGLETLTPRPAEGIWTSNVSFDQMRSLSDTRGVIEWRPMRVELRMAQGELDDGVDNNGNGLIDERQLVLLRDFGLLQERTIVLSRYVRELLAGEVANGVDDNGNGLIDEAGFCFNLHDDTLDLHLTLESLDHEGRLVTRTLDSSVLMRN